MPVQVRLRVPYNAIVMKNFLVTGCSGFIGSALSLHLLKQGHQVLGIDAIIFDKKNQISKNIKKITIKSGKKIKC
ncbi:GDP-mannose 4,6-dehydratase [Gammaproteobacteria bacterium]|nr:GDP-mannose 4,6-dehydratase [Gammaproteobacteria bacterium]